jgi:signal transduction histidine kinase
VVDHPARPPRRAGGAPRAAAAGGQVRAQQTTLLDDAREEHVVSWTVVTSAGDEPHRSQLLCFGADVTEERRRERDRLALEAQLHRSQQLEAVGTLALGIAHDINNILTPITAYSELLEQEVAPGSEARSFVLEIQRASARAADLVRRVLSASRRSDKVRRPVSVQAVAREVCRLLQPSLGARIRLRTEFDDECPPVSGDASELHQALLNLGTNAGHAMRPDGGVLTVTVARAVFPPESERAREACVRVRVADTGHGMDPETLARIFEPFYTTKGVGEGTGLGLWVVHGVVQNAGGFVAVHSTPGVGTTFDLFFPVGDGPSPAAVRDERPTGRGQERILVVDDEPSIARLLVRGLSQLGYRVTAVHRGTEAVDAVRASPGAFDLVLTDLTMPDLDGVAVARQLHAIRPDLPILLASGVGPEHGPEALARVGIRGTLLKPLTFAAVGAAIRSALDHPR